VLLHELLHPLLADPNAPLSQLSPDPWPTVSTSALSVDGTNLDQQGFIAQMAAQLPVAATKQIS
jgi:hypothetical protein